MGKVDAAKIGARQIDPGEVWLARERPRKSRPSTHDLGDGRAATSRRCPQVSLGGQR